MFLSLKLCVLSNTRPKRREASVRNAGTDEVRLTKGKEMPKFKVQGTVTYQVECEIEAPSLEEAQRIEYEELVNGDFESVSADYKLLNIVQVA